MSVKSGGWLGLAGFVGIGLAASGVVYVQQRAAAQEATARAALVEVALSQEEAVEEEKVLNVVGQAGTLRAVAGQDARLQVRPAQVSADAAVNLAVETPTPVQVPVHVAQPAISVHFAQASPDLDPGQVNWNFQNSDEANEQNRRLGELEQRSMQIAQRARENPESSGELAEELRQTLEEAFDVRLAIQEAQATALRDRLEKVEQSLGERREHRAEIIERRLSQLRGQPDALSWDNLSVTPGAAGRREWVNLLQSRPGGPAPSLPALGFPPTAPGAPSPPTPYMPPAAGPNGWGPDVRFEFREESARSQDQPAQRQAVQQALQRAQGARDSQQRQLEAELNAQMSQLQRLERLSRLHDSQETDARLQQAREQIERLQQAQQQIQQLSEQREQLDRQMRDLLRQTDQQRQEAQEEELSDEDGT